jgi:predicted kinase
MVGLPCSGKTTRAKELEKEYNALLLATDKWHIKLFGDDILEKEHDKRHENVE